jgi:cytochrome c-type biogenesis protein CcmH/NrfF
VTRARLVAWVAVLTLLGGLLVVAAVDTGAPATPVERAAALNQRFACPQCDGQAVSESNAAVAVTIRQFILAQVQAGATDREIEQALVQSYGTEVSLAPPATGFGALVWVLPVVGFAAGATALAWVLTRDRAGALSGPSDEDRALVEQARHRR